MGKKIESIVVTYAIGNSFFPSPYYPQTIAGLELSEDKQILKIQTTENRKFDVHLTDSFIEQLK